MKSPVPSAERYKISAGPSNNHFATKIAKGEKVIVNLYISLSKIRLNKEGADLSQKQCAKKVLLRLSVEYGVTELLDLKLRCCHGQLYSFPMLTIMLPAILCTLLPMTSKADKLSLETEPVTTTQVEPKNLVPTLSSRLTQLIIIKYVYLIAQG